MGTTVINRASAYAGEYDGTLVEAGTTSIPDGRFGDALFTEGGSAYGGVQFDSPATMINAGGNLTMEAWVRPAMDNPTFLEVGPLALRVNHDDVWCVIPHPEGPGHDDLKYAGVTHELDEKTWTHVACTYASGALQLFVDATFTSTAVTFPIDFTDGFAYGFVVREFDGSVDDVALWNTSRSQTEICSDAGGTWDPTGVQCVFPK